MKISSVDENGWTMIEIYVKGDKKFIQREVYDNSGEVTMTEYVYQNGDTYNRYIETDEGKEAELNVEGTYPIVSFMNNLELEQTEVIVEVETGLCLEKIIDDCTTEYTYEFNNVDDDVFEEPDISEYTI